MIATLNNSSHYFWGDKCDSWVLCEEEQLNVKYEKMPPQTQEQLHFHQQTLQFFFVLKGKATFTLNGEEHTVLPQQGITIHPHTQHFIANVGDADLEFLVISQPPVGSDRVNIGQ